MNACSNEAASAQETEEIRKNNSTLLDGFKSGEGISPTKKETTFECNKDVVLSIAEGYTQQNNANILGENMVIGEITSIVGVKPEKEHHLAIKEVTTKENDVSIQMNRDRRETFKTVSAVDESTVVRFRNNFFEVIEELRIQRTLEEENEERIKCLMTEKHDLERKKEEEVSRNSALVERHSHQKILIKKQQEDRLLQYDEEKAKQTLAAECVEKELKVLKDEIRALHLMKYSLEKKIKEQERLIQLQKSARDRHESQMTTLEQRSKKAFDECTLLVDLVDKTESNVSAASHLQRKLMYTNEHQKCLLESYEKELESKRFELVALKATISESKNSLISDTDESVNRQSALDRELRMQAEVYRQSLKQLDDSKTEKEKLMGSLKEAHKLLDRHVQSINKHNELEAVVHLELDELKTEYKVLMKTLGKEQREKQSMEDTFKRDMEESEQQKQILESRLGDLQKQYESLSEAHNSLEQLNSNWSERNMEQKAKIELMLKEVDDLRLRLSQAEDNLKSQREINEQLKKSTDNETSSLKEKLLQADKDCRSQRERTVYFENEANALEERVENLDKNMKITEKENATIKSKVTADATCQTVVTDDKEVISLSEKLLKVKQICKGQTERAGYLETQCTFLNGKVDTLSHKIVQLEREGIKTTERITTAVQTNDMPKVNLKQAINCTCNSGMEIVKDIGITEPLRKESRYIQHREDGTEEEKDIGFIKQITETAFKITKAVENFDQDKQSQLLTQENDQPRLLTDKDNNSDKMRSSRDETLHDPKESSRLVSPHTEAVTTTAMSDTLSKLLPSNCVALKSNNKDKCTNEKKIEVRDFSGVDENEITSTKAIISSKTFQQRVKEDVVNSGEIVLSPALSGIENNTEKNKIDSTVTAVNNIFNEEDPFPKRVRFNAEGSKTSSLSESYAKKKEVNKEDPQMMFSDEEDGGRESSNIDEDVSQRISRIQNLLRSDRLRTNRKRKYPVV